MKLTQLIYVSAAKSLLSEETLDAILESSVCHNAAQGVTGLLLYWRGNFMQVLEGEESEVDETYGRICSDTRHHGIILILKAPIEMREFSHWAMGYRRLTPGDAQKHPEHAYLFEHGFASATEIAKGSAHSLLQSFYAPSRW